MKKYKRGLTAGVYDMFHIGHLNILKNAKKICNFLIVAVSTDEVVYLPHTDGISSSELRKKIITTNAMNNIKETKEDL